MQQTCALLVLEPALRKRNRVRCIRMRCAAALAGRLPHRLCPFATLLRMAVSANNVPVTRRAIVRRPPHNACAAAAACGCAPRAWRSARRRGALRLGARRARAWRPCVSRRAVSSEQCQPPEG